MNNELAWMIWTQTWQLTLLIGMVAALLRIWGKNRPHLAHGLWVVVLVKAVTPPIWSSPGGVFSWLQSPTVEEQIEQEPPANASDKPLLRPSATITMEPVLNENMHVPENMSQPVENGEEFLAILEEENRLAVSESTDLLISSEKTSGDLWLVGIFAVWAMGSLGTLVMAVVRWGICYREIRNSVQIESPHVTACFQRLCKELKIRRKVRLVISQSRIGPAVYGVFRPTVLIPDRIVKGMSQAADLDPVLAHELIHIRRGDLWVGWLQVVVQAVWWFHPLVWWVGRLLKREAERCCDEEVIASLRCPPGRYARALLEVLELKHILKPVPVLPGVKPVEITSKRLERIMLLRQGCRPRTPWWCWLVMVLAAAMTLPGAAFVANAKDKAKPRRKYSEVKSTESSIAETRMQKYPVQDLLEAIKTDCQIKDRETTEKVFVQHLRTMIDPDWQSTTNSRTFSMTLKGDTLKVRDTPRVQQEVARQLQFLRKHGFRQIVIESRVISAPKELLAKTISGWQTRTENVSRQRSLTERLTDQDRSTQAGTTANRVTTTIEKSVPVQSAKLSSEQTREFVVAVQNHTRANILQSPKVVTFNGQYATVISETQRPFVVGIQPDGKPLVKVMDSGIELCLRGLAMEKEIQLESRIKIADIRNVETVELFSKNKAKTPKIQVPEVVTACVNAKADLTPDSSIVIGAFPSFEKDGNALVVLLTVRDFPEKPADKTSKAMFGTGVKSDAGVVGQLQVEESNFQMEPPTDEEVLKELRRLHPGSAKLHSKLEFLKTLQIEKEKISESTEPPRFYPQIGPAQLVKARYKCTVTADETKNYTYPIPFKNTSRGSVVVYLDQSHLIRVKALPNPPKPEAIQQARYQKGDVQALPHLSPPRVNSDWDWARAKPKSNPMEKTISVDFRKVKLKDALEHLAKITGLNIVIDDLCLTEQGLTGDHPITMTLDGVKVSSVLKLMLSPLGLAIETSDDVVKVTSKQRIEHKSLTVMVYAVADLLVGIPGELSVANSESEPNEVTRENSALDDCSESLMSLIESTVAPDSWSEKGGMGQIAYFRKNLSLVIRQTPERHQQIQSVLRELRKNQDLQVTLEISVVEGDKLPGGEFSKKLKNKSVASLTPAQAKEFQQLIQGSKSARLKFAPKVTLFPGQNIRLNLPGVGDSKTTLHAAPTVSPDRRFVLLPIAVKSGEKNAAPIQSRVYLKDGHTTMLDVSELAPDSKNGRRIMITVTPRIIVQEEEEELLDLKS